MEKSEIGGIYPAWALRPRRLQVKNTCNIC